MKVFDCSCGGKAIPASQRGIHARSKVHSEWETAHGETVQLDYERDFNMPAELQVIADTGRADPVAAAKALRKYKSENPFTDFAGHGTVSGFLEAYNIPTINIPRGTERAAADKLFATEHRRLMQQYRNESVAV